MAVQISAETTADIAAREALLDRVFGEARFAKTSERLREGRLPADGLALVAHDDGGVVGTVRLWHVAAGPNRAALLLGPLAVAPEMQGAGVGGKLMRAALNRAATLGHGAVLLVGDPAYYQRFSFDAALTERLWLPGPYERHRFQALELRDGALDGARGMVSATGAVDPAADAASEPVWTRVVEELRRAA
ncbi:MAG: N-acetyltransferase [Hyphomicrobiaceae bacterium]|nr:N-acetyltransferase [Hyphomicrobiaceae bacterium]